ncbi:MAG: cytochrome b [Acetobacteraceae bacterium]|nr:cytochrome b [Acetobacteraceae bacterium]
MEIRPLPPRAAGAEPGYDGFWKLLHWLIAALVLIQFATKLLTPANSSLTEAELNAWHLAVGPSILALMLVRLLWRLTHRPPPPPADLGAGLQLLARGTHWAFYAVLIALPVVGWLAASAYAVTPYVFGVIPLPALLPHDDKVGEAIGRVHGALAWVLIVLAGLHVCGAFYHAAFKRDGVFSRMLP